MLKEGLSSILHGPDHISVCSVVSSLISRTRPAIRLGGYSAVLEYGYTSSRSVSGFRLTSGSLGCRVLVRPSAPPFVGITRLLRGTHNI